MATQAIPLGVPAVPDKTRRWLIAISVAIGALLEIVDTSIVNVALPSIQADLGLGPTGVAWVVNAYVLAFGSLLPPDNATGNFTKVVQRVPVRIRVPADVANESVIRPGMSVVIAVDTRSGGTSVAAR